MASRCLLTSWGVFTLLLVATFTADLAALLTVSTPTKITSLEDLLETDFTPVIHSGGLVHSTLKASENKVYGQVWDRMGKIVESTDIRLALKLVESGDYAYITDRITIEYMAKHECADLTVTNFVMFTAGFGFILPKNAPYKPEFDNVIQDLLERGVIKNWKKRWLDNPVGCGGYTHQETSLGLDRLAGCFLCYAVLVTLAGLCLWTEICCRNIHHKSYNLNHKDTTLILRYDEKFKP